VSLLDGALLRKLERVTLAARRAASSPFKGEHSSSRQGRSVEFSDYRNYAAGDDFRHIDWNAFGRLEKLYLKLFREESQYTVYVLLDTSASMELLPEKARYARQVAGALSYVALCGYDRVHVVGLGSAQRDSASTRASAARMLSFVEALPFGGTVDLAASLRGFARGKQRPGIVVVVSDFLQDGPLFEGLKALRHARHDVFAVQVLAPGEMDPVLGGDLRLVDCETSELRDVTMTAPLLAAYKEVVQSYVHDLQARCVRYGMGYTLALTSQPVDDLVMRTLRRERLLA
jgi:uncharacterized protein (DUF58 family)